MGKRFRLWKFRTMRVNAETSSHEEYVASLITAEGTDQDKPMLKIEKDPRIFPCGVFLRKACIDELPQLFNVFKGDMSLVGPRPPIPYEANAYLFWHEGRFDAVPGMTGLWQVSGKNSLTFKEMVRLDIRYARERSLALDIKILLKTFPAVLFEIRGNGKQNETGVRNEQES